MNERNAFGNGAGGAAGAGAAANDVVAVWRQLHESDRRPAKQAPADADLGAGPESAG